MTGPQWQGQQGPYGPPPHGQPYGPPPPYGQPPYGYPPKKSNAGLIVALVAGSVLLVGGAVAAVMLLSVSPPSAPPPPRAPAVQGTPPGSDAVPPQDREAARGHAEKYVAAINAGDAAAATELSCGQTKPGMVYDYGVEWGPATLVPEPGKVGGVNVVFNLEFAAGHPSSIDVVRERAGGPWCVR
ncbi:hypothetical protein ACFPM7_02520 [Actinokineospora guangxiensis]|uniref:DUF4878 domain-containing protein n=1 Tax=Actinokineospora guangxiensis TaxID=1490288 RepID=A0ABW0EEU4_9PSEU